MEGTVRVNVWSRQRQQNGERQTFQTEAEGKLVVKGEAIYIAYRESDESGLGSTLTTIRLQGQELTLIRQGETNMRQVLVKGKEQRGSYNTPYGPFELVTRTSMLMLNVNESGGRIEAVYNLRLAGEKCRMELVVEIAPLVTA
ncbi:uncharacterized beta-barrel protein YwiB (DUF1934 family) [Tumebacillus sp. BK434]|uniref:DUF1934 domain-containing protein n=1 Tax=Tumebacillus sp. BK434 TaxID=2512169 RepID=UPI001046C8C2|nr:DUF1934 domain-containing protein [Tumebacillus sp. BK434]TCP57629.1 uncharacterized beta-barrel protein YwiB (DUF1934 family) [Tumebacillus sp. BK434]